MPFITLFLLMKVLFEPFMISTSPSFQITFLLSLCAELAVSLKKGDGGGGFERGIQ